MTFKHYLFGTPGKIGKWSLLHALVVHIGLLFFIVYGLLFLDDFDPVALRWIPIGFGVFVNLVVVYGHWNNYKGRQM